MPFSFLLLDWGKKIQRGNRNPLASSTLRYSSFTLSLSLIITTNAQTAKDIAFFPLERKTNHLPIGG